MNNMRSHFSVILYCPEIPSPPLASAGKIPVLVGILANLCPVNHRLNASVAEILNMLLILLNSWTTALNKKKVI